MTRARGGLGLIAALVVAACGPRGGGGTTPAGPVSLTPAQIAERSLPSVVLIEAGEQLGTGFVIWQDGRIATNLHVILGAPSIVVHLADGRSVVDVEVMGVDEGHDLAVLRVPVRGLPALPLGDSNAVKPGERVVAIGHPLGLGNTVSDGLVSAVRELDESFTVLQISAPIAPGSSGGPLLNEQGEVIGVAFLYSAEGQNLNFAIPVNYLKPMLYIDQGIPFAEFVRRTQPARPGGGGGGGSGGGGGGGQPQLRPTVPVHPVSLLDDCPMDQLEILAKGLFEAINVGAPLYNQGQIEACYRIYEGAALTLEQNLKGCAGAKAALATGRNNAASASGWKDKAWAMRDAFDGLILVIGKKVSP